MSAPRRQPDLDALAAQCKAHVLAARADLGHDLGGFSMLDLVADNVGAVREGLPVIEGDPSLEELRAALELAGFYHPGPAVEQVGAAAARLAATARAAPGQPLKVGHGSLEAELLETMRALIAAAPPSAPRRAARRALLRAERVWQRLDADELLDKGREVRDRVDAYRVARASMCPACWTDHGRGRTGCATDCGCHQAEEASEQASEQARAEAARLAQLELLEAARGAADTLARYTKHGESGVACTTLRAAIAKVARTRWGVS